MKNILVLTAVTITCALLAPQMTFAQKGVGDSTGVARLTEKPAIVTLSGTLVAIKTGPCEATTGRALVGTHLILEDSEKKQLNVHLGPANVVAEMIAKLTAGQTVSVKAFRTDKMKENHYVAQSLTFADTQVTLRDETLRPSWAQGNFRQQAAPGGQGWRQGQGTGRGLRNGPRWRGGM